MLLLLIPVVIPNNGGYIDHKANIVKVNINNLKTESEEKEMESLLHLPYLNLLLEKHPCRTYFVETESFSGLFFSSFAICCFKIAT